MRELSTENLYAVADAFRVIELLAETIFETVIANDENVSPVVEKLVSEDAAIIADRMKAVVGILDAQYPGFREIIALADRRSQARARVLLAKQEAELPRN